MRLRTILSLAFVLALALPATALAVTESEPNDGIDQADGPLTASTNHDGAIGSSGEEDWYLLYVNGQGTLDIAVSDLTGGGCCGEVDAEFVDGDGGHLNSVTASRGGSTKHLIYTTPGPGLYYLIVDGSTSETYRLRATGPLSSGSRPVPGLPTPNNNPTRSSAFGPLVGGGLYEGRIDASGEEDWYVFYTAGAGLFDVALTDTHHGGCCGSVEVTMYDRDGEYLNSESASRGTRAHIAYTGSGPDAFYLKIDGSTEETYQLQITPAERLTDALPPFLTPACTDAEAKVANLKAKLAKAKARRSAATTRKAKKRAKRKVKHLKAKVKSAKAAAKQVC